MKKTLSISFDVNDPLDKTLWNHLKNLPAESRREFVLQSLLLNMHLPPIYQVCFLQSMLTQALTSGSTSVSRENNATVVPYNEPNTNPIPESTPILENSTFGLTRDAFKV